MGEAFIGQVGGNDKAGQEGDHADAAEQVQRSHAIAGQKSDGQEVKSAAGEPRQAELGGAVFARVMLHRQLGDLEAAAMGDDRQITMQLAIDAHGFYHFATVHFQAAVEIVQANAAEQRREIVVHARGEALDQGVMADFFPA